MINKSLKETNSLINHDFALLVQFHDFARLVQWLRANKISLNTSKTEIVIFSQIHKIITKHLHFRINGKKINLPSTLKYLGVILHQYLEWTRTYKLSTDKTKQGSWPTIQNTALRPKISFTDNLFSIFNSHLICTCQIWGQKENTIKKLSEIHDKDICIKSFKNKNPTNELYYINKILKIANYIKLLNCLFIKSILSNNRLPIFENLFKKASETHSYSTRHATVNSVFLQ